MIDLKIEELRNSSEIDHCESCNLLNENSVELIIIKNKDLYIYKFDKKKKKNYLIYETKLNGNVIKLVVLKNVFLNKKSKCISGILLIYKNLHFIIYKYNKSLNTLVVILKHNFTKEINFQSLFYNLPHSIHYTHKYEKTKRRKKKINKKIKKNYKISGCFDILSKKKREKDKKINVIYKNNKILTSDSSIEKFYNDYDNEKKNHENEFLTDFTKIYDNQEKNILNRYSMNFKSKIKSKKIKSNFCEFCITFSYDFKTIYTIFYTTRKRKIQEKIINNEVNINYFSYDLYIDNISKINLENFYKNFVFIKKIFFHDDNAHILIQNDAINIGHTKLEELNLKLLIIKIEKDKFDFVNLIKSLPNDLLDIIIVNNILICLCYDYVYILNLNNYKKVVYFFNKSCYINNIFHFLKNNCLFYDHSYINTNFKLFYLYNKKNKIFILNKYFIIEGIISKNVNDLINLIKWDITYTFNSNLSKSSFFSLDKNIYFLCCYDGLNGNSDIDLLKKRDKKRLKITKKKRSKRKRVSINIFYPLKKSRHDNKFSLCGNSENLKESEIQNIKNNDSVVCQKIIKENEFIKKEELTKNDKLIKKNNDSKGKNFRKNNNFLFDLLNYLNKNISINECTKELNNKKYDLLFKKYKKKIKILENNFSKINAQGIIEYVSPLFILKKKKNNKNKKCKKIKNLKFYSVDKIQVKGLITDICKLNEENNSINKSIYFAVIGNKKNSTIQKVFFEIPLVLKLNTFFSDFNIKSVCCTDKKNNSIFQYVIINLEEKAKIEEENNELKNFKLNNNNLNNDELKESLEENEQNKKNILLCIKNISFLKKNYKWLNCDYHDDNNLKTIQSREFLEKIHEDVKSNINKNLLNDNVNDINYSDEYNFYEKCFSTQKKTKEKILNNDLNDDQINNYNVNKYTKVIYMIKEEKMNEEDFSLNCIEKIEKCLLFFKNSNFNYFNSRDVRTYLKKIYIPYMMYHHVHQSETHHFNDDKEFFFKNLRENNFNIYREMKNKERNLKKKILKFFLIEKVKNTSLNLKENSIGLLNFKQILIQVCKNEINLFFNKNTYICLKNINIQNNIKSCKLIKEYLILLHENNNCSIFSFNNDIINNLLKIIIMVTSVYNIFTLHCLSYDNKEENFDILSFGKFLKKTLLKNCSLYEKENVVNIFKIKNVSLLHDFVKSKNVDVDNFFTYHTSLNNIRCISVIKKNKECFLCFLDNSNNSFNIFDIKKKNLIFQSNFLLNVPKYIYNSLRKEKNDKKKNIEKDKEKLYFLNIYNKENIINILFFKLDKDYILIIFLTGRPILIYKTFFYINKFSNLKFKIVIHKYVQPLISNIHFLKEENDKNINKMVIISSKNEELNNGCYVYVDENSFMYSKMNRKKKKQIFNKCNKTLNIIKKKTIKNCIILYPYFDMKKLILNNYDDKNIQEMLCENLIKKYNTSFPILFLSSYKGKLYIHNLNKEKLQNLSNANNEKIYKFNNITEILNGLGENKNDNVLHMDNIKGIIKIDNNEFLSFSNHNLHMFSINDYEYKNVHNYYDETKESKNDMLQSKNNSLFSENLFYCNKNFLKIKNEILFLKKPKVINLSFNDDLILKNFINYPYIYKMSISKFEYILKKSKKKKKKKMKEILHKNNNKDIEKETSNEINFSEIENKNLNNNCCIQNNEQDQYQKKQKYKTTFGKVICVIFRIKYDEYYCLKKLLKKRINIQKDELKNNSLYRNEEIQCIPNAYLDDCINNQYTHKIKSFLSINIGEETNVLQDETIIRKNNKLIQSVKTHTKYYKLLLFHENSKNAYGYYIFEHSEEIQCVSFGCLNNKEYIYVSTSLNINERIETQGNIYVLDFSDIFLRYNENDIMKNSNGDINNVYFNNIESNNNSKDANNSNDDCNSNYKYENKKNSAHNNDNSEMIHISNENNLNDVKKKGKLIVYLKKTYNSSVTQIHPFYFYSDNNNSKNYKNNIRSDNIENYDIEEKYRDNNLNNWNNGKNNNNCYCNILHCINSKLYIHEINDNDFTKGAFIDNNFYISDIKIVKNFIIIADLYKGIYINMYNYEQQHDSRSIISISKNFYSHNLNILCCHYVIYDSYISIIAMDIYNNFLIFSYKNYQDIDNLYIFNYFNFNRRIIKFINALNKNDKSNSVLSISNDGSIHLFYPLNNKLFIFFKEIYKIIKKYIFPNLALNLNTHLKPDFFIQSIILNLHKRTDSFLVKNILFDDLLKQVPFYSSEVLFELFYKKTNLLQHIAIGDFLNELYSISQK
ncbi:conserved Plasmodium protein, unknown function [Plasmodium gallinaceum]|uniref:RSE1/DDB1/CPSF1 C-terminal domain-containing protein n=1 Tax=Plasmodium gallinaceum TaxID=5849 RepID=A0A1J1GZB6_PLAGA|nr:conserved Plasmodium protein, unknown function [Plasmodium gallinaceum]CRG97910.1 conserved Plasmodium protein, unknown function [Plasmodium gallinaceum]